MNYKFRPWRNRDTRDGLRVNTVQDASKVSRYSRSFTPHDDDKVAYDGDGFRQVSIAKRIGKINRYKSYCLNSCKTLIAGRS